MSPENQRFDVEVAFPCDIDLDWFLVPKSWVRQIVLQNLVYYTLNFVKTLSANLKNQEADMLLNLEVQVRNLLNHC